MKELYISLGEVYGKEERLVCKIVRGDERLCIRRERRYGKNWEPQTPIYIPIDKVDEAAEMLARIEKLMVLK